MDAKSEIMSSKLSFPTKSFSIERIDKVGNLSSRIVDLKYDFINLSFEKLLSQLAIETATVRSSLKAQA